MRTRNQGPSVRLMGTLPRELWQHGHDAVCVWTCGCCGELLDEEDGVLLCRTCGQRYDPVTGEVYAE